MKRLSGTVLLMLFLALVGACNRPQPTPVAENPLPSIELISPPSGTRIPLHEEIEILTRSADERGIDRVELWVDGEIYRVDPASGQPSFPVIQRWRADKPGDHQIKIQAIDIDGQASVPAILTVQVIEPATATPTPIQVETVAVLPTSTPTVPATRPATATPTFSTGEGTSTPAATGTLTPEGTTTPSPEPLTPTPGSQVEMVLIPAGTFLMGSNSEAVQQAADWCGCNRSRFEDELYIHEVYVSDFYIDKYEVTNGQFQIFADATGYQTDAEKKSEANTWRTAFTAGKEQHPVVWMSWDDAYAYCKWAGKRLPTEAEWEKAARGTDGRLWPWGSDWDNSRLNMGQSGRKTTTPVGSFPQGTSPYGIMDMAGNVWEWVNDWYDAIYYQRGHDRDPVGPDGGQDRVLRGGSFNNAIQDVRTTHRHKGGMAGYAPDHGFRCAK
jgi:sulfatase modifying factor 1